MSCARKLNRIITRGLTRAFGPRLPRMVDAPTNYMHTDACVAEVSRATSLIRH